MCADTMPERVLRLLHITDTHLHANAESRMRGVNTYDTFRAVVEHAMSNPVRPDVILATGDLVQDETRAGYEAFRAVLKKCGVPVYCIPGNHDSPPIMADVLGVSPFQVGGELRQGNWSLIMLNSFSPGDDGGQLDQSELNRLQELLQTNRSLHTMICVHHQPIPMGSRWLDGVGLRNADEFFEIVNQYSQVKGILWGHVHQASDRHRKGIRLISTPSTCSQFLPNSDDFALDARSPGYRWLDLSVNGTITTEVAWLD
jgi:Icc protein